MKYLTDFRKTVETGMDPRSVHQGIKECLSMYIAILVLFSYDLTQHLFSPPPRPKCRLFIRKIMCFKNMATWMWI